MYRSILIFFMIVFSTLLCGQESGRILGIVTKAKTDEALANVNITIAGTALGASSNDKGAYLIQNVPAGTYTVIFSCMGFTADSISGVEVTTGRAKRLDAQLLPKVLMMQALEVQANRLMTLEPGATQPGKQQINPAAVENIAGGLNDLTRVISLLSGVNASGDYTSDFAVRGGGLDQNVVYMDGIVVPNPYRMRLMLGGGFSLFNPTTIEKAEFSTGHFSGQYGNFLSSVMSLDSREGRRDRFGIGGGIDFVQTHLTMEGPLSKRGSWLLSTRRSYVDVLARPYAKNQTTLPYMYDLDGKLVYDVTDHIKLSYKLLHAAEATKMIAQTEQDVELNENSNLNMHILGFESQISDRVKASLHTALYDESFNYHLYANRSDPYAAYGNYKSTVNSFNFHQKISVDLNDNHRLVQGVYGAAEKSDLDLETNVVSIDFTRRSLPPDMLINANSGHIAAYVDYIAHFTPQIETVVGLRYDYSELIKDDNVSAKLSFIYRFSPQMKAHAFIGKVHQYPSAMTAFTRDLPLNLSGDLEHLHAESATHYVVGFDRDWGYNFFSKVELYYKSYDNMLLPQDRIYYYPGNNGFGYGRGLELTIERAKGPNGWFSGLVSYTLAKSEYRDKYVKAWIPFNYDQRHGLSVMADATIHRNWGMNAVWRLNSGLPYNEILGYVHHLQLDRSRYIKSMLNDSRYPAYSRLDMRFYYRTQIKETRLTVYLDLLNVFNRKNIYERMYYVIDEERENDSPISFFKYATIYNMPFIPSLGVSVAY